MKSNTLGFSSLISAEIIICACYVICSPVKLSCNILAQALTCSSRPVTVLSVNSVIVDKFSIAVLNVLVTSYEYCITALYCIVGKFGRGGGSLANLANRP